MDKNPASPMDFVPIMENNRVEDALAKELHNYCTLNSFPVEIFADFNFREVIRTALEIG